MAFDDRKEELLQSIRTNAPPGDAGPERALLEGAVNEWAEAREEHLEALLNLLEEGEGSEAAEAWKHRTAEMRADLGRFADALRSVSGPAPWATAHLDSNRAADEKFVWALDDAVEVAEARDYMVTYFETVAAVAENFETKWEALIPQHQSYEQQELATIEQVERLIREAADKARSLDDQAKEATEDAVKQTKDELDRLPESGGDAVLDAAGVDLPIDNIIKIVGTSVETFKALTVAIEDQRSRLERYYREELGSILVLFRQFRADTQRFVEEFGYRKVEEQEKRATDALSTFVSAAGTSSANGADAQEFADRARTLLRGHVNEARQVWDEFVLAHEKKFFGPVGPDIERALFDRSVFEERYQRLEANDLLKLAEMWRSRARDVWDVDLGGIPEAEATELREALGNRLRDLDAVLADPPLKRIKETIETAGKNAVELIRS